MEVFRIGMENGFILSSFYLSLKAMLRMALRLYLSSVEKRQEWMMSGLPHV